MTATVHTLQQPVAELYPAFGEHANAEEVKAAFFRGEPFVDAQNLSRTNIAHFAAGDLIRIRYLKMRDVDALEVHSKRQVALDLTFSITFTIPEEL